MKWLVGVGRTVLNHHEFAIGSFLLEAVVLVAADVVEQLSPERRFYTDVKKALNDVELLDSLAVGSEIFSNLLCSGVGSLV